MADDDRKQDSAKLQVETEKIDSEVFLATARDEFKEAKESWDTIRELMNDDLRFLEGGGSQWPSDLKNDRDSDGRPCLEINKLPTFVDQVVGDQLQNRPGLKVRPVDSAADPDTADILTGLIRNIENISDAEVAYDTAFEGAAQCGYGAWRVVTQYIDDDVFEQDIRIKRIANQFTVYPDYMANEIDYSDGRYFYISEELPRSSFEEQYPKSTISDFDLEDERLLDWVMPETVRVAERFYRRWVTKLIVQLMDAEQNLYVFYEDELPEGWEEQYVPVQTREVKVSEIWWAKVNGLEILEGPQKWPGKYFPIILCLGKELNVDGRKVYRGLIRHAKDPQRLYNYNRSLSAEVLSLAPKAPYLVTPKMIGGHEAQWDVAHKRNFPYLYFNPDPNVQGMVPQRQKAHDPNLGIQQEVMVSDQEIHDTTGLQLAALGKRSNEQSGRAILARQREGDVGSYAFVNSLARAIKYQGKVLVDLIPKIYDTARMERVLGEDGSEKRVMINQAFNDNGKNRLYDITTGKYDVVVTTGPSYTTKRQEASESMLEFISKVPGAAQATIDLVAKNLDWPDSDEFRERLKKLVPIGIREPDEDELQQMQQQQQQPPPDPKVQLELAQEEAKVQQERMQLQGMQIDNEKKKVELAIKQAELQIKMAGG